MESDLCACVRCFRIRTRKIFRGAVHNRGLRVGRMFFYRSFFFSRFNAFRPMSYQKEHSYRKKKGLNLLTQYRVTYKTYSACLHVFGPHRNRFLSLTILIKQGANAIPSVRSTIIISLCGPLSLRSRMKNHDLSYRKITWLRYRNAV